MRNFKLTEEYALKDLKKEMEYILDLPIQNWSVVVEYATLDTGLVTRTLTVVAYEVEEE
jgi:hypothetical protein